MSNTHTLEQRALVIGGSGGIAKELIQTLAADPKMHEIHCVSRSLAKQKLPKVIYHQVDSTNEKEVENLCQALKQYGHFSLIICCIGVLHGGDEDKRFQPEKRLESVNTSHLLRYFETNTIAPMMWLKQVHNLVSKEHGARVVFFTARVASIEDNHLGGWYGYRASKAALNMMIKTAQIELTRRSPKTILVSYHPGTVDTGLSKPFQKNVPDGKLFSAQFTVAQLLSILPSLSEEHAPHYIDWQGKKIPW